MIPKTQPTTGPDGMNYTEYTGGDELIQEQRETREALAETLNAPTPPGWAVIAELTRRRIEADRYEKYCVQAPPALTSAAEQYFNNYAPAIIEALRRGGVCTRTVNAVIMDYGATLCGCFEYTATPEQMAETLNGCDILRGFLVDKYVFCACLLWCYQRNLNTRDEYTKKIKDETDAAARRVFFIETFAEKPAPFLYSAALYWLQNSGFITVADFAGIDREVFGKFFDGIYFCGRFGLFVLYVYLAQYALNATPEQLADLPTPPGFGSIKTALDVAKYQVDEININLERLAEQVEAALNASPDAEQVRQQSQPATETGKITYWGRQFGGLLSRELYGSVGNDRQARDILPYDAFIIDYLKKHPTENTTTGIVERAIMGVNLLQQQRPVKQVNGVYTLYTNITEFSTLCGYGDANNNEKQQLFTALRVLNNTYVVAWRKNGRYAVKLLTVREVGLDAAVYGNLVIDVTADVIKGQPIFVSSNELAALQAEAKGSSKRHFMFQILTKGHKTREDLAREVFGYDRIIQEAQGYTGRDDTNPEGVRAARDYIRKHKARNNKLLEKWFDDYQRRGIITHTTKQTRAGLVDYWQRIAKPTAAELAAAGFTTEANPEQADE